MRIYSTRIPAAMTLSGVFVICLLTLAVAIVALELAQRDLRAARLAAEQAALVRQSRHLKGEVLSIASASAATRRLRHDIANQVGVVDELLGEGYADVAGRYLADLQDRARALGGDRE